MVEIKLKESFKKINQLNQLDILFEIYKLREAKKKIESKLNSMKRELKSSNNLNIINNLEALKVIVTEDNSRYKDLTTKVNSNYDLFELGKNLAESKIYLKNLESERKNLRIDPETYEITRGYYLQKVIDTINSLTQLRNSALSYFEELKNELITLEDQRIVLTTDKMRRIITKEVFKEKINDIEVSKQRIEEKLAFLQVEIIDCDLIEEIRGG
jgi:hypothetical protein